MNHGVRRQGFGARWGGDVGQTGGSGLSIAESRQGVLLGGVSSAVKARPGHGRGMWVQKLAFSVSFLTPPCVQPALQSEHTCSILLPRPPL